MKFKLLLFFVAFFAGLSHSFAGDPAITREKLFEGAEFPERRSYPVSETHPPCQDFYEYACNRVVSDFKLRDDRSYHIFSFSDQEERLLHAKKNFMKALPSITHASKRIKTIQTVYEACMNADAAKVEEKELVRAEVARITGIRDRAGFKKLISDRIDQPERSFVAYSKVPNADDPNWDDLVFEIDLRSLPEKSYYQNPEVMKDLEALVTDFFKTIGMTEPEIRAKSVIAFEKEHAEHFPQPSEIRARVASKNWITREELLKKYPALELKRFLNRIPEKVKFNQVLQESLDFGNAQLEQGNLDRLKNVLLFQSVKRYMDDAYPEFFSKKFQFHAKHLGGPSVRPDRQERCTTQVMSEMQRELEAELLPILFPDFPREKAVRVAEGIRSALLVELKENQWLSSGAKAEAITKMSKAKLLLVSPRNDGEWYFNPPAQYSSTRSYANSRLLAKNITERDIRELSERRNRNRWLMGPLAMNAYYVQMDNVFVLPIGILQYPFFDAKLPFKSNLAAIGSIIGHELGHGIDDKGSLYNHEGRLHAWLTEADLKNFQARGAPFVERFDKIGQNGKLTLGENIGDHVGITSAYRAAFHGKKPKSEAGKAFFLQYARMWCGVLRPSFREMLVKTNTHPAGEFRVNEQVKHLSGFHEAYGCKEGDPMYLPAEKRIKVW